MRFFGKLTLVALLFAWVSFAQSRFVCPMDPDVRSDAPGRCPRCGMTLVPVLREPIQNLMEFRAEPPEIPADRNVVLEFRILDPVSQQPVQAFSVVHEKLFHLFLVNQDLSYFSHEHPVLQPDGWFRLETRLPKPGTYRLVADFDPSGGTPQFCVRTISTQGYAAPLESSIPHLAPDLSPKQSENLRAELTLSPEAPLPGKKTILTLRIQPASGLEKYIGAWAHLFAASEDLIDTMHTHPFLADGSGTMQFSLFFPRAATYRVWIQMQRNGVVNTVSFTIPVRPL